MLLGHPVFSTVTERTNSTRAAGRDGRRVRTDGGRDGVFCNANKASILVTEAVELRLAETWSGSKRRLKSTTNLHN